MADNDYLIKLKAALDKANSQKQIDQDIRSIEKAINQLHLVASLYKGDSRKQINSVINQLENKVNVIKLKAKIDNRQTQNEVDHALKNVAIKDIKINEQGIRLKARKIYSLLDSVVSKFTFSPVIEFKKDKLQKNLTEYLNKNSKINESSLFSNQAGEMKELFASVDSTKSLEEATGKLQLFKAEVEASGYVTAEAANEVNSLTDMFKDLVNTIRTIPPLLSEINTASVKINIDNVNTETLSSKKHSNFDLTSIKDTIMEVHSFSKVVDEWEEKLIKGESSFNILGNAIVKNEKYLQEYLSTCTTEAPASLSGYRSYLKSVGVETDALRIKTILLESALSFGIGAAIQLVIGGIAKLFHSQEDALQAAAESTDRIKSLISELKSNQKTISETAQRFAEIAQGVDTFTGKNLSLSTGDYEEFLFISNQLADIFPNLSRVYDENGNAIVQLSGNVDTIVGSLNNLIQAQRDLVNDQVLDNLPTEYKSVSNKSKPYEIELEELERKRDALLKQKNQLNSLNLDQGFSFFEISSQDPQEYQRLVQDYSDLLNNANIKFEPESVNPEIDGIDTNGNHILTYKTRFSIESSEDDLKNAKDIIDANIQSLIKQYSDDIVKYNDQINAKTDINRANWSSLNESITAWLSTDSSYKVMSDSAKSSVQQIINNLDWSTLDFQSWKKAKQYIQNNILDMFKGTDGAKIGDAFDNILNIKANFQNGKISLSEYENNLNNFKTLIENFDDEAKNSIDFILSPKTSNGSDLDTIEQNISNKLKAEDKDKINKLSLTDLEIADTISVPNDTLLSWEELLDLIGKYKKTANSVKPLSTEEVITKINSLSEKYKPLDNIMNSIRDKDNPFDYALLDDKSFKSTFSKLGEVYTNFIDTITKSPKDLKATQSAYDSLITTWIESSGALNGLTDENANLAASMLENMGIENAEEIVLGLLNAQKIEAKLATIDLTKSIKEQFDAIRSELATYGLTGSEIDDLTIAYANAQNLLTTALSDGVSGRMDILKSELDSIKGVADAYNLIAGKINESASKTGDTSAEAQRNFNTNMKLNPELSQQANAVIDYGNEMDRVQTLIEKTKNTRGNIVSGGGAKTNKASGSASKNIDFIDRQLQLLEDKRSELIDKASSNYIDYLGITQDEFNRVKELFNSDVSPMSAGLDELSGIAQRAGLSIGELHSLISQGSPPHSKRNYLSQVLEVDKSLLIDYEKAVQQYQSQYGKALEEVSPENRDKIENGASSIDTLSGEEAEKVQNAISARDKLTSTIKKQSEMQEKYIQDSIAPYESKSEAIENQNKQIENANSLLEKQIDYYKSAGEIVDSSFYDKLIQNTGEQIINTKGLLENKRAELNEMLDRNVSKTSKEYVNLKSEISDTEVKIYALSKAQEEYNNQLLQLPIENLTTVISMYKDINSTIENWGSELEASGKKLDGDYYQSMISNGSIIIDQYKEQASVIEDAMDHYDVGSDNWNELYGKLQNVNSEMSSMVQNLYKWNEELLKMPMENISNYSSELEKVTDGLSNVKNEYDTVISAVTGALNDQIDTINKQKDAANEEYEASKKSLQDKLDLLNKQNEELKLQQTYEQALYNLQKVNQQATEQVIRGGQVVYEQDADKLREAQEAVQDARYDLETNKIQSQIDDLQETLDGLNDNYQEQIDSLQKISDKWSEISDKITQAQDEAKASEILGNDWKNKVLSGNDTEIFDNFSGMYTEISEQLKQYQEQIDTTNNIYSLLEDYIASYKDGTISYEQALTGINGLLAQMNQTMSANGNLQNIYDYLSAANGTSANADSLLDGIRQGLTTTANELLESLAQYKKNSGTISEYTSSWQQLTDHVSAMLDVLKEVRDNLEDASDSDDDSSKHSSGEPYMGGGYVYGGPGDHREIRKTGIVKGLVGTSSVSDREARMKLIGLKKLDPDEIPAILHKNEAVFNTDQQDTILRNFAAAYRFGPNIPDYRNALSNISTRGTAAAQEFTFNGGITIQECNNTNELAQGILNGGLRSALIQESGKR